ncbi:MAG: hypothetical protein JOS17DRAFT_224756 [Linnemannia elongata]|nr:MAG: hypothetical protein JOS17DRAFT_224756 [Linnemannia elongata]
MTKPFTLLVLLALFTLSAVQADVYCFCHNWLQQVVKTETRLCLGLGTVPQFKKINSKGVVVYGSWPKKEWRNNWHKCCGDTSITGLTCFEG